MRRPFWSATLIVLAHAVVVYWHLVLLAKLGSSLTPAEVPLFSSLANLIPLSAVILLWAHFPRVGASMLLFLAVPLAIGGYSHFLSPGADNIFRMAPGELAVAFRVSAVLLLILESLACWVSIQILRHSSLFAASA
jgi:hypothetical protein